MTDIHLNFQKADTEQLDRFQQEMYAVQIKIIALSLNFEKNKKLTDIHLRNFLFYLNQQNNVRQFKLNLSKTKASAQYFYWINLMLKSVKKLIIFNLNLDSCKEISKDCLEQLTDGIQANDLL